jgi:hypothetical protein
MVSCSPYRHCRLRSDRPRPHPSKFLTTWSWALIEKPPVTQLIKNFPKFSRTRSFITVFTRVLHSFVSWARWIQSYYFFPDSYILIMIVPYLRRLLAGFPPRRPRSISGQVMWDLWWTKWHWGRFSPSTSVSPANFHSTNCSTVTLIYHLGLVQ